MVTRDLRGRQTDPDARGGKSDGGQRQKRDAREGGRTICLKEDGEILVNIFFFR